MAKTKFILGIRDAFFDSLYEYAKRDRNVVIVSADNGAPSLDKFSEKLKDQFFTVGIAEQQMIGMAAGLALEGKKVYTYAIAPFVTTRVHEQVKIDICSMKLPIVCLGIGAGYAYDIMGPTHHTVEDISIMRALPGMKIYSPADAATAAGLAAITYKDPSPQYVRFDRAGIPDIYTGKKPNLSKGFIETRNGRDLAIIAHGVMVHEALRAAEMLAERGLSAKVIDLFRVKPVDEKALFATLKGIPRIVTMEEHLLSGGMGSMIAEIFSDRGIKTPLLRIGQDDRYVFDNGGRHVIWRKYGLDAESAVKKILRSS